METRDFWNEAMKYRMVSDYHTHTTFSHGHGSIEDNVKVAIFKGLKELAITDHGPGHITYGIKRSAVPEMRRQVEMLKLEYPQIKLYLGVEANVVNAGCHLDVSPKEAKDYDFIIGGYHYGVKNGFCIKNWTESHLHLGKNLSQSMRILNTDMTVKALYENDLKILTHPGDKGEFDILEIARACEATNTLMEISARHSHLTTEEIRIAMKTGAKFVISSDAHQPKNVGAYLGGVERALEAGLDLERIVNIEKRED